MNKYVKVIRYFEVSVSENDINRVKEMDRVKTMMKKQGMELKYKRKEEGCIIMGFFKENLTKDVDSIPVVQVCITGAKIPRKAEVYKARKVAQSFSATEVYHSQDDDKSLIGFMCNSDKLEELQKALES